MPLTTAACGPDGIQGSSAIKLFFPCVPTKGKIHARKSTGEKLRFSRKMFAFVKKYHVCFSQKNVFPVEKMFAFDKFENVVPVKKMFAFDNKIRVRSSQKNVISVKKMFAFDENLR